jgi:hypothetical protein
MKPQICVSPAKLFQASQNSVFGFLCVTLRNASAVPD